MTTVELLIYIIFRGLAIGILVSAPMGPIGVLCIQRTLNKGRRSGLATGIGASLSDLFYAMLTGFGLSIVVDFIENNQSPEALSLLVSVFTFTDKIPPGTFAKGSIRKALSHRISPLRSSSLSPTH